MSRLLYLNIIKEAASALVAFNMLRNSELSDFQKGEIVGYHRNGGSLKDISKELNIPKSVVASVIMRWKVSGDSQNVLRPSKSKKLTEGRELLKEIWKNHTKLMSHIL